jgi:hypothetical protein
MESIRSTADLRSWFTAKHLLSFGHDVFFYRYDWNTWKLPETDPMLDHLICTVGATGITTFSKRLNRDVRDTLRPSVKGYITEMSDHYFFPEIKSDMLFSMTPITTAAASCAKYIGWGADDTVLYPEQPGGRLNILVDHSYYGLENPDTAHNHPDMSKIIMEGLKLYYQKNKNVRVVQLRNEGLTEIDMEKPYTVQVFDRGNQVPYPEICKVYNSSHIFIVTHGESLGISVIESAMAGSHIMAYCGAIKPTLIDPLSHSFYDPSDPQSVSRAVEKFVISGVKPIDVRQKALKWTWGNSIQRLLGHLERGI